jgi:hypothetical protein
VNLGLHNNTTTRYDEATATLSLTRTFDFFNKKLKNKHLSLLRKYCKKNKKDGNLLIFDDIKSLTLVKPIYPN